jgi:hypothetical protein
MKVAGQKVTNRKKKKINAIPVTGRAGPQGWDTLKLQYFFLDTVSSVVISLKSQPLYTPKMSSDIHTTMFPHILL